MAQPWGKHWTSVGFMEQVARGEPFSLQTQHCTTAQVWKIKLIQLNEPHDSWNTACAEYNDLATSRENAGARAASPPSPVSSGPLFYLGLESFKLFQRFFHLVDISLDSAFVGITEHFDQRYLTFSSFHVLMFHVFSSNNKASPREIWWFPRLGPNSAAALTLWINMLTCSHRKCIAFKESRRFKCLHGTYSHINRFRYNIKGLAII